MQLLVMDMVTSDGALVLFTAVGIAATVVSIVLDTRAQRARVVAEDVPVEVRRAA
jgi:hypothetical protein